MQYAIASKVWLLKRCRDSLEMRATAALWWKWLSRLIIVIVLFIPCNNNKKNPKQPRISEFHDALKHIQMCTSPNRHIHIHNCLQFTFANQHIPCCFVTQTLHVKYLSVFNKHIGFVPAEISYTNKSTIITWQEYFGGSFNQYKHRTANPFLSPDEFAHFFLYTSLHTNAKNYPASPILIPIKFCAVCVDAVYCRRRFRLHLYTVFTYCYVHFHLYLLYFNTL